MLAADGEVVWSWRLDAGVKLWRHVGPTGRRQALIRNDGDKTARSPGRARSKPLKPLRVGMPGESGVTVVTMLVCFVLFRTRGFCNGPRRVNPFLRHPFAGDLLLFGIGAGPSPDGVHERNRSANLRKA